MYPKEPKEDFKHFIPIFKEKFENGTSSKLDEELKDNTIYIYCNVKRTCNCNEKRKIVAVEDEDFIPRGCAIWEWVHNRTGPNPPFMLVTPANFVDRMCPNSNLIVLRGYVVGEYCSKRNILVGSDWTHDKRLVPTVKKILSSL